MSCAAQSIDPQFIILRKYIHTKGTPVGSNVQRLSTLIPTLYCLHTVLFVLTKFQWVVHELTQSSQAIITEINEKIGATGVVSQECKTVVSQYGQQILDLLLAEVCNLLQFSGNSFCQLYLWWIKTTFWDYVADTAIKNLLSGWSVYFWWEAWC